MYSEEPSGLFQEIREAEPDGAQVARIQEILGASKRKARWMPPDRALIAILLAAFVAISIVATIPVGFDGFERLGFAKRIWMYGSMQLFAGVLGAAIIEQMVPGSRRRVPAALSAALPVVGMAILIPVLFPDFGTSHFVHQGIPCLRLGLLCAIPSGALCGLFLRWGYLTTPIVAGIAAGALSGMVGLAVLALHCPIQNATHVLTWHLGVIVIATLSGGVLGWAASRFR